MKISVVIPAYNEEKYLPKTLESIADLDRKPDETIVIDGGSTDKTAQVARSLGVKVVTIAHRGIGYARQKGILAATGDIIADTDADTLVPTDWLTNHIRVLTKPDVVLSFGPFRVLDGSFPYYQHINYVQTPLQWLFSRILNLPFAAGQNMAFWREKALSIGGFNEQIKVMEDNDLAFRMRKVGRVVFLANNWVTSSGRRSQEGWGMYTRLFRVYIDYFFHKNRSLSGFTDYR